MMKEIAAYTRLAYEKGFVSGTGGNVSLRMGSQFYITVSGVSLRDVDESSFVPVSLEWGEGLCDDQKKPSKEARLHQAIYHARPDLSVIFHLHPVDCIAAVLMLEEYELLPCYVPGHLKKIGRPPQIPYYPAGSVELAKSAAAVFQHSDCAWMRRHGIVLGAEDCKTAFARVEDMVDSCRLHLLLQGVGALSEEEIRQLIG